MEKERKRATIRVKALAVLIVLFCGGFVVEEARAQQPGASPSAPNGNTIQLPTAEQQQQTFDKAFDQIVGRPPDASRYVYARELSALNAALYNSMRNFILAYEKPLRDKVYLICYVLVPIFFIIALLKLAHEPQAGMGAYMLLCFRAVLFIALAVYGPQIINLCGRSGLHIAAPFRQTADLAQNNFNKAFQNLVQNSMIINWSSGGESKYGIPEGLYAILFSPQEALANPSESLQHIQTFASDVRNWFYLLVHSQALLQACTTFIMFLGFTIVLMTRIFAPFAILVGIDRSLAHRITYNYLWGIIAWCLFTPTVMEIFRLIAYGACRYAVEAATPKPISINPVTLKLMGASIDTTALGFASFVMITFGLAQFGAPYVAYRLSQGQLIEGVITNLSTWAMTAIGTGIEMIGVRFGATLNRRAGELQYYATQTTETGMALNRFAQEQAAVTRALILGRKQAEINRDAGFLQNLAGYKAALLQAQGALRQALIANTTQYNTNVNISRNDTLSQVLGKLATAQNAIEENILVRPEVAGRQAAFYWENYGQYNIAAEFGGGALGGLTGALGGPGGAGAGAGIGASLGGSVMNPAHQYRDATGLATDRERFANWPYLSYFNTAANRDIAVLKDRLNGYDAGALAPNMLERGRKELDSFGGKVPGLVQIYAENKEGMDQAAWAAYHNQVAAAVAQKRYADASVNTVYQGTLQVVQKDFELSRDLPKISLYGTQGPQGVNYLTGFKGERYALPSAPGQLELIQQQFRANMKAAELHYTAEVFQGITRDMSRRLEDAIKSVTRY